MSKKKRILADLKKLRKDHGDVRLSEAIEIVGNSKGGRPAEWDETRLWYVYFAIEAMKDAGLKTVAAQKRFVKFNGRHSYAVVKKRYQEARRLFEPTIRSGIVEYEPGLGVRTVYRDEWIARELIDFQLVREECDKIRREGT
jgi:hypothetical protein